MNWFTQGLGQFRSLPPNDKIPVLLCGPAALTHLLPSEFDTILDETGLKSQIDVLSRRLGTLWLDRCVGAISDFVTGVAITPQGFPGRISFPIFPFRSANNEAVRKIQCVARDKIEPTTFARFFGLFKKLPAYLRPRVLFLNDDQADSIPFFEPIRDLVDLFEVLPDRLARVRLKNSENRVGNYFDLFAAGSFAVTANQKLEFPNSREDASEIKRHIVTNYHICMAQQHDSEAFSVEARRNINELLHKIDYYLLYSDKSDTEFLIAAKIQSLLLRILIEDDSSQSLYEAISLSKAVENLAYEQKCLRFSNQIAGVSSYALDCLKRSADAIARICDEEPYNPLHRLEYFAVMQNLFITRLFNRKNIVDVGEAVSCLEFATEQYRYFDELSMLANSVGASYLVLGNLTEADRYLELASSYSADRLTHLNIRINHLICRYLLGSRASTEMISAIFDEYKGLPFATESAYHAAMAFGNLWRLASDKDLKHEIANTARQRNFILPDQDGSAIIRALKERGFLFMNSSSFTGPFGAIVDHSGLMPAFHFNWSTPVAETSPR